MFDNVDNNTCHVLFLVHTNVIERQYYLVDILQQLFENMKNVIDLISCLVFFFFLI